MPSITLTWTTNDNNTTGGQTIERTSDGGSTWSIVDDTLGPDTETYTDSTVSEDTTYQYRIKRSTDHTSTTSGTSSSVRVPKTLTRSVSVSGSGATASSRTMTKARTSTMTGSGSTAADRVVSKPRVVAISGSGETDSTRIVSKTRSPTLTATGGHSATQTLRPVFPDERALDVQWDFSAEHMGFASEWLNEDSIIEHEIRDGLGVTIGGDLSTTIEVILEYDQTGDGVADVTSEVQDLSEAYHTLAFDDKRLFDEDGWYRVIVRGLRAYDTVNQLDIGAIHANL